MADHIVALVPLDEYSPLGEFPPFLEAQDGACAARGVLVLGQECCHVSVVGRWRCGACVVRGSTRSPPWQRDDGMRCV